MAKGWFHKEVQNGQASPPRWWRALLLMTFLSPSMMRAAQLVWAKRAGGTSNDSGNGIAVDSGGNSYVTGQFAGSATFGSGETNETTLVSAGSNDIFVAKFSNQSSQPPEPRFVFMNDRTFVAEGGDAIFTVYLSNNSGCGVALMGASQGDFSGNVIGSNSGDGINVTQNSSVQLGEDPGLFAAGNSGAGNNGGFGIGCDFGGALDGLIGTLNGNMGQTNIDASCPNSLSP